MMYYRGVKDILGYNNTYANVVIPQKMSALGSTSLSQAKNHLPDIFDTLLPKNNRDIKTNTIGTSDDMINNILQMNKSIVEPLVFDNISTKDCSNFLMGSN